MRIGTLAAALLVASAAPASAKRVAQEQTTPSVVHAKLEGPIAILTARFVLTIDKDTYAQSLFGIDLPTSAMVTAATAAVGNATHALALTEADDADKKFDALMETDETGPTPGERRNAVLIAGEPGNVTISVAAARSGVLAVELTAAMPTCFFRDARYIAVPAAWRQVADFSLRGAIPAGVAAACDEAGAHREDAWIGFPAPELTRRGSGDRIGAFAGRVALGEEHIARVEVDLSSVLSDVPRDLATVILVDASRSMSAAELETQRQIVRSYLQKAPDSRVQVIAYARRARPLLPGWTAAAQAAGRVDRELRALAPRNGSNFDAGLVEAASWLERIAGTRRVILVTDERMAARLGDPSAVLWKRLLPANTLVHVVAATGSAGQLERDEDAVLAPLAAATDGMAVRAGAPTEATAPPLDATLLVRPISVDRIQVKAPGWTEITPVLTTTPCVDQLAPLLPEGRACTWWGEGDGSSGQVLVEGLVWGKRVQRMLVPDLARGRDLARELSAAGSLEGPLLERAHAMARAVDDHWSLYAEWGGPAKYAAGFGYGQTGGGGTGGISDAGGIGHGPMGVAEYADPGLERQLRPLLAKCRVEADRIEARLEMTLVEIVNVEVSIFAPPDTSPATVRKQQQCVEDALWDATPMLTRIAPHQTYNVTFPAIAR